MSKQHSGMRYASLLLVLLVVFGLALSGCNRNRRNQPEASTPAPPTPVVDSAPVPTLTPTPDLPPEPTDTPVPPEPTATDTPVPPTTVANTRANLHQGPSTAYPIVGQVPLDGAVEVVEQSPDGQWLKLANNAWIYRPLVDGVPSNLPIAVGVTPTPRPTAVPQPTATPEPSPAAPVTNTTSNLRRGPGTDFPLAGQLPSGASVRPVARNSDGTWLQLESEVWIWAQLVDHVPPGLPVASVPSTPVPPTNTPVPQAPPTSTPVPQAPASPPSTGDTHRDMLVQLPVGNRLHHNTYDRDEWDHWVDDDRDCENARAEVLIAESRQSVTYRSNGCTVDTGLWVGPWGGRTFTQASQVDIDHHVPLFNAHVSGGHAWSRDQKRAYANDLSLASALQATESGVNRAKGAGAPDEWRPPVRASWCLYARDWIEVKHKYELRVTRAEKSALSSMLDTCTGPTLCASGPGSATTPGRAGPRQGDAPASEFPAPRRQGRYCNDFDSRAQYEAFYAGREKPKSHDRDGDGRYCEALN